MRILRILALAAPFALAACGGTTERTVVVNPAPAAQYSTSNVVQPEGQVVLPPGSNVQVCPAGGVAC